MTYYDGIVFFCCAKSQKTVTLLKAFLQTYNQAKDKNVLEIHSNMPVIFVQRDQGSSSQLKLN